MSININIPGIGSVSADNAATESTLQNILAAVRGQNTIIRNNESTIEYIQGQQQKSAQSTSSQLSGISGSAQQAGQSINRMSGEVASGLDSLKSRTYDFSQYLTDSIGAIAQATSNLVNNLQKTATDPIGLAAKNFNTALDLAGGGIDVVVNMFGAGLKKLTGSLTKGANESDAAFNSRVGQTAANMGKYINNFLGGELQGTVDSFREMNRMGMTLTSGLDDVREVSGRAGLMIPTFTQGIRSAQDSIRAMGTTMFQGASTTAKVMEGMATQTADDIEPLRSSMRRLGYEFEDQVALSADYLAMQRTTMSAEQFREYSKNLSERDTAVQTMNYAKNLKLLSELTGASASQLSAEARERAMSGVALASMSAEESEKYGMISAGLEKAGGGFIAKALEQQMALGTVTDENFNMLASAFPEMQTYIESLSESIKNGDMSAEEATAEAMKMYGDVTEKLRAGIREGGPLAEMIKAQAAGGGDLGGVMSMIESSTKFMSSAQDVSNAVDNINSTVAGAEYQPTTDAFINMGEEIYQTGVQIQNLATDAMPQYTELLQTVNGYVMDLNKGIISYVPTAVQLVKDFGDTIREFIGNFTSGGESATESKKSTDSTSVTSSGMTEVNNTAVATTMPAGVPGPQEFIAQSFENLFSKIQPGDKDVVSTELASLMDKQTVAAESNVLQIAELIKRIDANNEAQRLAYSTSEKLLEKIAKAADDTNGYAYQNYVGSVS